MFQPRIPCPNAALAALRVDNAGTPPGQSAHGAGNRHTRAACQPHAMVLRWFFRPVSLRFKCALTPTRPFGRPTL